MGLAADFNLSCLRMMARIKPDVYGVTAVLTSCGRHELLNNTLSSFFECSSFPLNHFIVVEDGDQIAGALAEKFSSKRIEWIATGRRVGQIAAIDYAYSRVQTPYIFHLEDDWEFFHTGFIEKSMSVLRSDPDCLQVWLRSAGDTNRHPLKPHVYNRRGVCWQNLVVNHEGKWHGFSFNPGLRRLSDYTVTQGYGNLERFDFNNPWKTEIAISKFYKDRGMHASILCDRDGAGYVHHTGDSHHTPPPVERNQGD